MLQGVTGGVLEGVTGGVRGHNWRYIKGVRRISLEISLDVGALKLVMPHHNNNLSDSLDQAQKKAAGFQMTALAVGNPK